MTPGFWSGRRVFLTGHTGFKGGWLRLMLGALGAEVAGYAQDPPTRPSFFEAAGVGHGLVADTRADIRDLDRLGAAMAAAAPEFVFHLAAQPLVRASYADPVLTYATNVMGTAHVLDAARAVNSVRAIIAVTTDKVYENREWVHPYRETDRLGGHDPYGNSKACAELVVQCYRDSFFVGDGKARIAAARAGNVIGGGDWAADRLIPDCVRAFAKGEPIALRYPKAVRPWQHVLEPLAGYLLLAEKLAGADGLAHAGAWNFGPAAGDEAPVRQVADAVAKAWGGGASVNVLNADAEFKEAGLLRLDSTKARLALGWRPRWNIDATLHETVRWYKAWSGGEDMRAFTAAQIKSYLGAGFGRAF